MLERDFPAFFIWFLDLFFRRKVNDGCQGIELSVKGDDLSPYYMMACYLTWSGVIPPSARLGHAKTRP